VGMVEITCQLQAIAIDMPEEEKWTQVYGNEICVRCFFIYILLITHSYLKMYAFIKIGIILKYKISFWVAAP